MCKDKVFDNMSIKHILANLFIFGEILQLCEFHFFNEKIVIYREFFGSFFEIKIIKLVASRPRHLNLFNINLRYYQYEACNENNQTCVIGLETNITK
jgi:hypothetical protein